MKLFVKNINTPTREDERNSVTFHHLDVNPSQPGLSPFSSSRLPSAYRVEYRNEFKVYECDDSYSKIDLLIQKCVHTQQKLTC